MTDETLISTSAPPSPAPLREGPGTRIGPYKLVQLLGEGGFGAVFLAEQEEPVRRLVALKILKLGMDTREVVARFEQERQALAMMDHPNIARVIDAGATDTGRPYFVMDLVKGDPIAEYCDKHHLSIEERLDLFAQVCSAVQHAHTKGIIHRDLKPSNILVHEQDGRATAKVIDFGIAKATSAKLTDKTLFTQHHQVVGTVHYMSPEQAEGSIDIDTRADVYALGVVLYELLTGTTPFDSKTLREAFYSEVQRLIREVDPPKPSTRLAQTTEELASIAARRGTEPKRLSAIVRGELDWIVMKAIEKDRTRRYESASDLALDLRRYLDGEAVVAAPPSASYRMSKFVRRHKGMVGAAAAVAAALLIGAVGFAWQASVAQDERDDAIEAREGKEVERKRAQSLSESEAKQREIAEANERKPGAINRFLLDMLGSADLRELGRDATVAQALDEAAAKVGTAFEDRPEVEAAIRGILGTTYTSIGMLDQAEPQLEAALDLNRRLYGEESIEFADSLGNVAFLHTVRGEFAAAAEKERRAVEIATKVMGPEDRRTLGLKSDYANALVRIGRAEEAEAILREALAMRTRLYGRDSLDVLIVLNSLGVLTHEQRRLDEAESFYREAAEIGSLHLGPAHPDTLTARMNVASLLDSRGRYEESEPMMLAVLADFRSVYGDSHPKTATAEWALGNLYRGQGRHKDALPYLEKCVAIRRQSEGETSEHLAEAKRALARTLSEMGEEERAASLQREVVAVYSALFGANDERSLEARLDLANLLPKAKAAVEIEAIFRDLLEICPRTLGEEHALTFISSNSYGVFLMAKERYADAEPYVRKALEVGRRVDGEDHPNTIVSQCNLAFISCELGRLEEAEELGRDTVDRFTRVLGPNHPHVASARGDYGRTLVRLGRNEEARRELEASVEIWKAAFGEGNSRFCSHALDLSRALLDMGLMDEAETGLREIEGIYLRERGLEDRRTALTRLELGRWARLAQRFDDAEPLLVESHGFLVAARPPGHRDIRRAERYLAQLYAEWNASEPEADRAAKAAEWAARVEASEASSK